MSLKQIDFTKVLTDDQVYDHMMDSYEQLGRDWIVHQWNWMNNTYTAFKDHYKYLIIISLVEKTLQLSVSNKYTHFHMKYLKMNLKIIKMLKYYGFKRSQRIWALGDLSEVELKV